MESSPGSDGVTANSLPYYLQYLCIHCSLSSSMKTCKGQRFLSSPPTPATLFSILLMTAPVELVSWTKICLLTLTPLCLSPSSNQTSSLHLCLAILISSSHLPCYHPNLNCHQPWSGLFQQPPICSSCFLSYLLPSLLHTAARIILCNYIIDQAPLLPCPQLSNGFHQTQKSSPSHDLAPLSLQPQCPSHCDPGSQEALLSIVR